MCTLTVVTRNDMYLMAMNRDEKIARGAGSPPEIHEFDGARAIYPGDGDGGTWFATNEYGIALALLNWNAVAPHVIDVKTRSRGRVIPALIDSRSLSGLHAVFDVLNFKGMMPFRLVGVFPSEQKIWEWRWDSTHFGSHVHVWESRHWFSSSLSDDRAESTRGAVCRTACHESDTGSVPWLRRLHASHAGGPGPFSLCVHREDVKTLSYSEVMVTAGRIQMGHFPGSPCTMAQIQQIHSIEIERADCPDPAVWGVSSAAI
jgi:Transport and Golgi organisation 2